MIELKLPARPKEMVPIVSDGPFSPAVRLWRLQPPQDALIAIVKMTLLLRPGGEALPMEEPEPLQGDIHVGEENTGSLRYASDFALFKPRADLTLVGHAYPSAPKAAVGNVAITFGRAARAAIAVVGDREWEHGKPTDPKPFTRVPLSYEYAFGGPGFAPNPVGLGIQRGASGKRLPNLERADRLIRSEGDHPPPACFAPVPMTWPGRSGRLGSYEGGWERDGWPYFPGDFDFAYFNVAPMELQIPYPRGDEDFQLTGVHPELVHLQGKLPGVQPLAFVQMNKAGRFAFKPVPLHLDTVAFDADALRVSLVWRGSIPVSGKLAPEVGQLFVTATRVGVDVSLEEAQARYLAASGVRAAPPAADPFGEEKTQVLEEKVEVPPPPAPTKSRAAIEELLLSGASLAGVVLAGCDLAKLDLSGKDLSGAVLDRAWLNGTKLDGANLRGAVLTGVSLAGASLRGADLRGANLSDASLVDADCSLALLEGASMASIDGSRARFTEANLKGCNLSDARLDDASFEKANATLADFSGCSLARTSFKNATLDDAQMYNAGAPDIQFDQASMLRFRGDDTKFTKASFVGAKATDGSFARVNAKAANFSGAELSGAVLNEANLESANLNQATAKGARFRHARLVKARALAANLMEANFEGADLSSADFSGANLYTAETLDAVMVGTVLDGALVAGTKLARS